MGPKRVTQGLQRALGRIGKPGRIGLWLLELGGVAYLLLGFAELLGVPSRSVWDGDVSIGRSLLFLVAISLIGSASVRIGVLERRAAKSRRLAEQARTLRVLEGGCRFLLSEISQRAKINPVHLGVSVWVASEGNELQRVARHRFASRQASGVTWTKHKGAIGRCWLDNDWLVADLVRLRDPALNKDSFPELPDAVRLGMSWDESRRTARYAAVWAEPLRDDQGNWIGCLSVDCEADGSARKLEKTVRPNPTVLSGVETIAINLAAMLELEKP